MIIAKTTQELDYYINRLKSKKKSVGFAPTMGALHDGHLSLIRKAKRECGIAVCSIFVNPTQFNNAEDLANYPVTIEKDKTLLNAAKCDILFLPSVQEMYPNGFAQPDKIDFGFLAETLEGEFRPGHFDGMAQVVKKLLYAVKPDVLYMGQKDFQQAAVVRKMLPVLKLKTKLTVCPIIREKDGLAMSSRNVRLTVTAQKTALELSKTLRYMKRIIKANPDISPTKLLEKGTNRLSKFPDIKTEYIAWRKTDNLKPFKKYNVSEPTVLLVAAWVEGVRLIDNILV